jgi:capsular polysaccharide transport system ATP-binding protein
MHPATSARLIHLLSVAKSFTSRGRVPKVVLRPTTAALPADRRVALLGQKRAGKTVLLRMLAGIEAPDQGEVFAPLQLSPLVNSGGLFHPQLTGIENIRHFARMFGIDADRLTLAVDAFCGIGTLLSQPVKSQDANHRKAMEAAVTAVLPFDCYLVDDMQQFAPEMAERYFDAASQRQAGVIFATSNPRLARQFAEFVVVIRDGTLYPFRHVEEAIPFYERHQQ